MDLTGLPLWIEPGDGTLSPMDPAWLEALRRNSGLRLTVEGDFLFQEGPVPNSRVQELFHRGLSLRDDGEVILTVGEQWAYVQCDGVARFVDGLRVTDDVLRVQWRGDGEGACADPALGYGPDARFYLWEADGAWPAILSRRAHQQLAELLREDGSGAPVLQLGSLSLAVVALDRAPAAAHRSRP